MFFLRIFLCSIVLFPQSSPAQRADAYHWIDSQGRSHFGDSYTPGARAIELQPQRPNPEQLQLHQRRQRVLREVLQEQSSIRRQQESQQKHESMQQAQARLRIQQQCDKLTARLRALESAWEVKRRRGYKTIDKRNFVQKRDLLRNETQAVCR